MSSLFTKTANWQGFSWRTSFVWQKGSVFACAVNSSEFSVDGII